MFYVRSSGTEHQEVYLGLSGLLVTGNGQGVLGCGFVFHWKPFSWLITDAAYRSLLGMATVASVSANFFCMNVV